MVSDVNDRAELSGETIKGEVLGFGSVKKVEEMSSILKNSDLTEQSSKILNTSSEDPKDK